jgi:hypothetical protein
MAATLAHLVPHVHLCFSLQAIPMFALYTSTVQRRAAYAAKKEAAQLEAALAASKSSCVGDSSSSVSGGVAAGEMSEEEMLAQAMQASLAISQVLRQ